MWTCCGGPDMAPGPKWEGCFAICGGWYGEYGNGPFEFKLFGIVELLPGTPGINWEQPSSKELTRKSLILAG